MTWDLLVSVGRMTSVRRPRLHQGRGKHQRSIQYAVRDAESKYPRGRLLILSDNLALVLALCKQFYIAVSHAVWLLGGVRLIFQVDTVGVEFF